MYTITKYFYSINASLLNQKTGKIVYNTNAKQLKNNKRSTIEGYEIS